MISILHCRYCEKTLVREYRKAKAVCYQCKADRQKAMSKFNYWLKKERSEHTNTGNPNRICHAS